MNIIFQYNIFVKYKVSVTNGLHHYIFESKIGEPYGKETTKREPSKEFEEVSKR